MSDEIEHFRARATARPGEAFAQERLFRARMLAFRAYGDPSQLDGAAEAARALGTIQRDANVLGIEASLHLARHEFQPALRVGTALAGESPSEAARYRLFDVLWATGDRERARALLEGPLDTLSTDWLTRTARVLDSEGLVSHARDRLRQVVENVQAYAEPAAVQVWALVELGRFELHAGDPRQAVRRFREALRILPGSPAATEGLAAVAYGVDRDLERARRLYGMALDRGAHLDLLPVLADIEEELGNEADAWAIRDDFIRRATVDEASLRLYGRPLVFVLAERPETRVQALQLANAELEARRDVGAWDALSWVWYRSGDPRRAWRYATRGIEAGFPSPPAAYRAGRIAAAAGRPVAARRLLLQALDGSIELSPGQVRDAERALRGIDPEHGALTPDRAGG